MTREFAWKPRWATIRLVNSLRQVDVRHLERAAGERAAAAGAGGADLRRSPELTDVRNSESPAFSRPDGLVNDRQRELADGLLEAVGEHARDRAVVRRARTTAACRRPGRPGSWP